MFGAIDVIDLILAILHHCLAFGLVSLIVGEHLLLRPGLDSAAVRRLVRIDAAQGIAAGLLLVVGLCRLVWGLKGWEYYASNHAFWGKMAMFLIVGLLTIIPTRRFLRWNKAAREGAITIGAEEVRAMQKIIRFEMIGIVLILVFAAMMARGYGS